MMTEVEMELLRRSFHEGWRGPTKRCRVVVSVVDRVDKLEVGYELGERERERTSQKKIKNKKIKKGLNTGYYSIV